VSPLTNQFIPNVLPHKTSRFYAVFTNIHHSRLVAVFSGSVGKNTFLGGKIYVFNICVEQIFPDTTPFGEAQSYLRGHRPIMPRGYGPAPQTYEFGTECNLSRMSAKKLQFQS